MPRPDAALPDAALPDARLPEGRQPYGIVRVGAVALAALALGYGGYELVAASPRSTRPVVALEWLVGVLAVHDAVLAPVAVLLGWVLTRLLPPRVRRGVAAALFAGGCLALVASAVLLSPSAIR